jgi:hypothetical protein
MVEEEEMALFGLFRPHCMLQISRSCMLNLNHILLDLKCCSLSNAFETKVVRDELDGSGPMFSRTMFEHNNPKYVIQFQP